MELIWTVCLVFLFWKKPPVEEKEKKGLYQVTVYREMLEEKVVEIDTDSPAHARQIAQEMLDQGKIVWIGKLREDGGGIACVQYLDDSA